MPACFWNLCHCPDAQPCVEHTGTGCSIVNGVAITNESQIADANTRAGEAAIAKTDSDSQRLDAIKQQLEAKKAQLERERGELEQMAADADSIGKRRAVVEFQRTIARRHANLEAEVRTLATEIDSLGASAAVLVAPLSAALRNPYSDPTGYCACYQEKLKQLQVLSAKIGIANIELASDTRAFNAARTIVLPKLRITFTLAFVIFLAAFIFLSVGAALVVGAFLALFFTAITVVGLAIQLGVLKAAVLASRAKLYRAWLSYYRVQQIPTCVRTKGERNDCERDGESHEERERR